MRWPLPTSWPHTVAAGLGSLLERGLVTCPCSQVRPGVCRVGPALPVPSADLPETRPSLLLRPWGQVPRQMPLRTPPQPWGARAPPRALPVVTPSGLVSFNNFFNALNTQHIFDWLRLPAWQAQSRISGLAVLLTLSQQRALLYHGPSQRSGATQSGGRSPSLLLQGSLPRLPSPERSTQVRTARRLHRTLGHHLRLSENLVAVS